MILQRLQLILNKTLDRSSVNDGMFLFEELKFVLS